MNTKEMKIVFDENSKRMSFYRMEGGRWCLIDSSDDNLRPYLCVPMTVDCLNENFFKALRIAVPVSENERFRIYFAGMEADRDALERRFAERHIEILFIEKEPCQSTGKQAQGQTSSESAPGQEGDCQSAGEQSQGQETIPEEQTDENTGLLKEPEDCEWSWRKNFRELCRTEKEVIRVCENQITEKHLVLVNKIIVLQAHVSISARIECIHCSVFVVGEDNGPASVDIMGEGALWLKHCTIENPKNKAWSHSRRKPFLKIFDGGELHIYDSFFLKLAVNNKNCLVENEGICHIVDTDFQKCSGNFFENRAEFCGAWLRVGNFAGQFISNSTLSTPKNRRTSRLENCQFSFGRKQIKNDDHTPQTFLQFEGIVRYCRFEMQDEFDVFGKAQPQIIVHGGEIKSIIDKCMFRITGKMKVTGNVQLSSCEFENCTVLDGSLLTIASVNDCKVENCKFHQCICREVLAFIGTPKKRGKPVCTIENNKFYECIAEQIICGANKLSAKELSICDNEFVSCTLPRCLEEKKGSALLRDDVFFAEHNKISKSLTSWVQEKKDTVAFFLDPVSNNNDVLKAGTTAAVVAGMAASGPIGATAAGAMLALKLLKRKKDKDDVK